MTLDYSIFNAVNSIFILLYFFMIIGVSYIVSVVDSLKGKLIIVILFAVVTGVMLLGLNSAYSNILSTDSVAYDYKVAIETGTNKRITENYYNVLNAETVDKLNFDMQHIDMNKAELGLRYGYGVANNSNQVLNLLINSTIDSKGLPIIIIVALLSIMFIGDIIVSRSIKATNYLKENHQSEIDRLKKEIKGLEETEKQYKEKAKQYDINVLKKNAKELLDKKAELESDIDEKKRSLKKFDNRLAELDEELRNKKNELKEISYSIDKAKADLKEIEELKANSLNLPYF